MQIRAISIVNSVLLTCYLELGGHMFKSHFDQFPLVNCKTFQQLWH